MILFFKKGSINRAMMTMSPNSWEICFGKHQKGREKKNIKRSKGKTESTRSKTKGRTKKESEKGKKKQLSGSKTKRKTGNVEENKTTNNTKKKSRTTSKSKLEEKKTIPKNTTTKRKTTKTTTTRSEEKPKRKAKPVAEPKEPEKGELPSDDDFELLPPVVLKKRPYTPLKDDVTQPIPTVKIRSVQANAEYYEDNHEESDEVQHVSDEEDEEMTTAQNPLVSLKLKTQDSNKTVTSNDLDSFPRLTKSFTASLGHKPLTLKIPQKITSLTDFGDGDSERGSQFPTIKQSGSSRNLFVSSIHTKK